MYTEIIQFLRKIIMNITHIYCRSPIVFSEYRYKTVIEININDINIKILNETLVAEPSFFKKQLILK